MNKIYRVQVFAPPLFPAPTQPSALSSPLVPESSRNKSPRLPLLALVASATGFNQTRPDEFLEEQVFI